MHVRANSADFHPQVRAAPNIHTTIIIDLNSLHDNICSIVVYNNTLKELSLQPNRIPVFKYIQTLTYRL